MTREWVLRSLLVGCNKLFHLFFLFSHHFDAKKLTQKFEKGRKGSTPKCWFTPKLMLRVLEVKNRLDKQILDKQKVKFIHSTKFIK